MDPTSAIRAQVQAQGGFRDDEGLVSNASTQTHVELIAQNRRTSMIDVGDEFLLHRRARGRDRGPRVQIARCPSASSSASRSPSSIDIIGWLSAVRATIALTHAVEVRPEQAKVLHNVIEGLCIRTGLPKPTVYIVDDPAPNAFAFGRSPERTPA